MDIAAFRKQVNRRACGLASVAMILDDVRLSFSTGSANCAILREAVLGSMTKEEEICSMQRGPGPILLEAIHERGMTLEELSRLTWHAGFVNHVHYGSDFQDSKTLRRAIERILSLPGRRIILNYDMTIAGQPPFGGHFSPIAKYDPVRMGYVVYDTWIDTAEDVVFLEEEKAFQATQAIDKETGISRGFMVVLLQGKEAEDGTVQCVRKANDNVRGRAYEVPLELLKEEKLAARLREKINETYLKKGIHIPGAPHRRMKSIDQLLAQIKQSELVIFALSNRPIKQVDDVEEFIGGVQFQVDAVDSASGFWGQLWVCPSLTGLKLGSMLLDIAEIALVKRGVTRLNMCYLSVERFHEAYGKNYRRRGYRETGIKEPTDLWTKWLEPKHHGAHFVEASLNIS